MSIEWGSKMIKMVITDVDGTIVGKDEVLHPQMITFAKELKQRGIYYTIATGRVDGLVQKYIQDMEIEIPYSACNGGTIGRKDEILYRKTIPLKELEPIIDLADEMGMSLMYSIGGVESAYRFTEYVAAQQKDYNRYHNPVGFTRKQWNTLQIEKLIVMALHRDGSIGMIEELCKKLPAEIGYKRYKDKAIDILPGDAAKEAGVRELAGMMNVRMEEVLFAGDDLNDVEAIKEAGIGVAVGNAQECAKLAADYIALEHNYKGVMEAVRKYVTGE